MVNCYFQVIISGWNSNQEMSWQFGINTIIRLMSAALIGMKTLYKLCGLSYILRKKLQTQVFSESILKGIVTT